MDALEQSRLVRKPWGTTTLIRQAPTLQIHRIIVEPGGYSSEHRHHGRSNAFAVCIGTILVRTWDADGRRTERRLYPGEQHDVPPGVWHQFYCDERCIAYELYYRQDNANLDEGEDIERRTENGREAAAPAAPPNYRDDGR